MLYGLNKLKITFLNYLNFFSFKNKDSNEKMQKIIEISEGYDSKNIIFFIKFEFITSCTCEHFRVEFKYPIELLIIIP